MTSLTDIVLDLMTQYTQNLLNAKIFTHLPSSLIRKNNETKQLFSPKPPPKKTVKN